jgi:hypothetical protein
MEKFRPRHVVTIVVALSAAAILAPVAVHASTGTLVNITDAVNAATKARVTPKGQLYVAQGDPYNGTFAHNDTSGRQLVSTIQEASAKVDTINDLTLSASDTRRPMFSGIGTRKVNLTSLVVSGEGAAGSIKLLFIAYVKSDSSTGDCEGLSGFGAAERFTVMVPTGQTVNITWPSALSWTQYADSNDFYCIDAEAYGGPSGYTAHISAYGFKG